MNLLDQSFMENFEHHTSKELEILKIYGLELRRETTVVQILPGIDTYGCSRFYINGEQIECWNYNAKTGELKIIYSKYAYRSKNFKPVDAFK